MNIRELKMTMTAWEAISDGLNVDIIVDSRIFYNRQKKIKIPHAQLYIQIPEGYPIYPP